MNGSDPVPTLPARSYASMSALAMPSCAASIGPTHEYRQVRLARPAPVAGSGGAGVTGKVGGVQLVGVSGPEVPPPARLIVTVGGPPKPEVASCATTETLIEIPPRA